MISGKEDGLETIIIRKGLFKIRMKFKKKYIIINSPLALGSLYLSMIFTLTYSI